MRRKWSAYFHVHHDQLCELSCDIEERRRFIKKCKPKREQPRRLKLLRAMRNPPKEFRALLDELNRVHAAYCRTLTGRARWDFVNASIACVTWLDNSRAIVRELHEKQCPNCPWNGRTIFPRPKKKRAGKSVTARKKK